MATGHSLHLGLNSVDPNRYDAGAARSAAAKTTPTTTMPEATPDFPIAAHAVTGGVGDCRTLGRAGGEGGHPGE